MATITFNVFKLKDGFFSTYEQKYFEYPSVREYLFSKFTEEEKSSFCSKSTKQTKNQRYRAAKSEEFKNYCELNKKEITSSIVGSATISYDGRLKESSIKCAVIRALNQGEKTICLELSSNKNKPAHLHMAYKKDFIYEEI